MNTQACSLLDKKCVPCEGGMPPLTQVQYKPLLDEIHGWTVIEEKKIQKEYSFKNFKEAVSFINKIAEIAESEGHHPDINLHNYKKVTILLWTHAIGGLSENDFILAAKIDALVV